MLINSYYFAAAGTPISPTQYWRAVFFGSHGSWISIGELEMASSPGGPNLCTGGTPSSGGLSFIGNLFDGNPASIAYNSTGVWYENKAQYILPTPAAIVEFRLQAPPSDTLETPRGFVAQASYDSGATWVTYGIFLGNDWANGEIRTYTLSPTALPSADRTKARVWRINATARGDGNTTNYAGLAEMEMAATTSGTNLCINGASAASYMSSNYSGGEGALRLTNGTIVGQNAFTAGSVGAPYWFGCIFAVPTNLAEVRMWAPNTGSEYNYAPGNFTIEWSSDGVTYHVTDTYSGVTWPSASFLQTFSVSP